MFKQNSTYGLGSSAVFTVWAHWWVLVNTYLTEPRCHTVTSPQTSCCWSRKLLHKRQWAKLQVLKTWMLHGPVVFSRMTFHFQIYIMIPAAVSCIQLKTNTHLNCNGNIFIFTYGKMEPNYSYILCNIHSQAQLLFRKLYENWKI